MLIRFVFLFFLGPVFAMGQLPTSNIYHFTITKVAKSYRIKSPQFLTAFNKGGYNNQPSYFSDKVIYFATNYYDEAQTEIAKFDLYDKSLTRITYTEEKEYSPTPTKDSETFSVVRVETDNKTQTLSTYPLDGIGYAKRYMNNTSNIGYHTWLDDETVALFLVEEPDHNLAIAHAVSERRKIILDKIGRCLKVDKKGQLLFVHKQNKDEWFIKAYNTKTNKSTTIAKTIMGAEDFELLNDGSLLMASKSMLYILPPSANEWNLLLDMSSYGLDNITRIASQKNSLIVVNSD